MTEVARCSQPVSQATGWSSWGTVLYQGLSVSPCCWKIWHSAAAVARSALVSGSSCVEPMHNLHPCHHGHFDHGPTGSNKDGWKERLTAHRSPYLLDYWTPPLLRSPCANAWDTGSSPPSSLWRALSLYFFLKCLSHQFSHHAPSLSPDYPAKPLSIGHVSVYNCMCGHFPFQEKCLNVEWLKFCLPETSSFIHIFQSYSRMNWMLLMSTSRWYPHCPLFFPIVLKVLVVASKEEKGMKGIQIREKGKLSYLQIWLWSYTTPHPIDARYGGAFL